MLCRAENLLVRALDKCDLVLPLGPDKLNECAFPSGMFHEVADLLKRGFRGVEHTACISITVLREDWPGLARGFSGRLQSAHKDLVSPGDTSVGVFESDREEALGHVVAPPYPPARFVPEPLSPSQVAEMVAWMNTKVRRTQLMQMGVQTVENALTHCDFSKVSHVLASWPELAVLAEGATKEKFQNGPKRLKPEDAWPAGGRQFRERSKHCIEATTLLLAEGVLLADGDRKRPGLSMAVTNVEKIGKEA